MKLQRIAVFVFLVSLACSAFAADSYSFKVTNTTDTKITKILVSPDGKSYGFFDIGKGVKPGETVTLVWDESTNNLPCKEWVKAVFSDDSESKPAKFDFCENDLELEF